MRTDGLWVLVMNATRARLLRDEAVRAGRTQAELVLRTESRALRRVLTGDVDSALARRDALPDPPFARPLREDESVFVGQVVALLETHRLSGDFVALAIFAPPPMLALVTERMPPRLLGRVIARVPRNLIHMPATELRRILAAGSGTA